MTSRIHSTTDLRFAAPHDMRITAVGAQRAGYMWPPSTPFAGSEIVLTDVPDIVTGAKTLLGWTLTTLDTPRELWTGYLPYTDQGDTANGGTGGVC